MENLPDPSMMNAHDIYMSDAKAINALAESALQQKQMEIANKYAPEKNELEIQKNKLYNQYYAPDVQSQINQRNALTAETQQKTANPLLGTSGLGGDQAAIDYFKNKYGENSPQFSQIMQAYKQKQEAQNALIQQRTGMGYGKNADQQNIAGFVNQLGRDHPDWDAGMINEAASAYLSGDTTLTNGATLPALSGLAQQQLINMQGTKAPAAIKNQAANLDVLVNDLNDFDIDAVKQFAGPQGKARLLAAQGQMAVNPNDPNIDPTARRYLSAMNQAIINMDSMRKAFGTSVVPDYVYQTIGKLANPNSSIWNDPKQVEQNFKDVVSTMTKNRDAYMEKVKHGVTAEAPGKKLSSGSRVRTYNVDTGKFE